MKTINRIFSLALILIATMMTSCDGEKDLIIIEDLLPIKTSTLYMVGDAAPCGWNIGDPTALTPTADDPLVFVYEGHMNTGEIKLCLTPGNWDAPFIRPSEGGRAISSAGIDAETFVMWAGDPDNKWRVTDAGNYSFTFNLRNWTFTAKYLGA